MAIQLISFNRTLRFEICFLIFVICLFEINLISPKLGLNFFTKLFQGPSDSKARGLYHSVRHTHKHKAFLLLTGVLSACDGTFLMHKTSCPEGKIQSGSLCVDATTTKAAIVGCVDPDLADVRSTSTITLCDGTTAKGTLVVPNNCTMDGQSNCINSGNLVSADKSKASASKIAVGTTIAGITGTLGNCTSDGQTGCITTSTLKAADTSAIDTYDLRFGKSIAGISGARKDCRNGMNISTGPALYNYDGNTNAIGNVSRTGGTNGDWWDTIDDSNNGLGTATFGAMIGGSPAWSSAYYCNGSQISNVSNTQSWLTPSGVRINCDAAATCGGPASANNNIFTTIFLDAYTGLYVTNVLARSVSTVTWNLAVDACYNLSSGDSTGKWRLPTQKELMQLYIGGIYLQNAAQFSSLLADFFWSASSVSATTTSAWGVFLYNGGTNTNSKTLNGGVLCVR